MRVQEDVPGVPRPVQVVERPYGQRGDVCAEAVWVSVEVRPEPMTVGGRLDAPLLTRQVGSHA